MGGSFSDQLRGDFVGQQSPAGGEADAGGVVFEESFFAESSDEVVVAGKSSGSIPAFVRRPKAIVFDSRVSASRSSSVERGRTPACMART